jgi:site-specific recombinase XerD
MAWLETKRGYLRGLNTESTRRNYRIAVESFFDWYCNEHGHAPSVDAVDAGDLRDWRDWMIHVKEYAAQTINVRLYAMRGFLLSAGWDVEVNGMSQVNQPVEALSAVELRRLLRVVGEKPHRVDWLGKRNVAMVSLMARAGLRVGEVVGLRLGDVTIKGGEGWVHVRAGKGLKDRSVPLSETLRSELRQYLDVRPQAASDAVFLSARRSEALSSRSVQTMVRRAARRAGLDCTPHVLRHTFATRALRSGVDLKILQRILGHSDLTTTARYLHPTREDLARAVEGL